MRADANIAGLAIDPRTPDILLAGSGFPHAIYKTTTAGAIWTGMDQPASASNTIIAFAPSNPQIVYGLGTGSILKSIDAGEHWSQIDLDSVVTGFAVDPASANTVYVATWRGALKSVDGGEHWIEMRAGLGRAQVDVAVTKSNPPALLTLSDEFYRSDDRGNSWARAFVSRLPPNAYERRVVGDAVVVRVGLEFIANTGHPDAWVPYTAPPEPPIDRAHLPNMLLPRVERRDASTLYASGRYSGVYRSRDNGLTWSQWFDKEKSNVSYKLFFDPHEEKTAFVLADQLYIGAAYGDLYRTADDGASWKRLEVDTSTNVPLHYVTMLPTTPVTLFVATDDSTNRWHYQLWRSADAGDTWQRAEGLPSRVEVTSIAALPNDLRVLFVGPRGRGVFRSDDGGATWQPTSVK